MKRAGRLLVNAITIAACVPLLALAGSIVFVRWLLVGD